MILKVLFLGVYFKIFWMRGKTLRLQIKNRAKLNNEKNMMDLEKAIEEFHVSYNMSLRKIS